jgi:sugar phosphate isomerase/epimerase
LNQKSKNMRLKCALGDKAIEDRLKYNPEIIELHLVEEDIINKDRLFFVIELLQKKGIKVYIHHPMRHNGIYLDILSNDMHMRHWYFEHTKILTDICNTYSIQCIIHAHYSQTKSSDHVDLDYSIQMQNEIQKIELFSKGCFLWEDTVFGAFSYNNPYLISDIISPLNLNINFDTSHAFIALSGSNDRLLKAIQDVYPYIKYAHIVDSLGKDHDSLPINSGSINWNNIIPFIIEKPFIFEIGLSDFDDCKEMVESVVIWNNLVKKI